MSLLYFVSHRLFEAVRVGTDDEMEQVFTVRFLAMRMDFERGFGRSALQAKPLPAGTGTNSFVPIPSILWE
jgi:hypothetical protein